MTQGHSPGRTVVGTLGAGTWDDSELIGGPSGVPAHQVKLAPCSLWAEVALSSVLFASPGVWRWARCPPSTSVVASGGRMAVVLAFPGTWHAVANRVAFLLLSLGADGGTGTAGLGWWVGVSAASGPGGKDTGTGSLQVRSEHLWSQGLVPPAGGGSEEGGLRSPLGAEVTGWPARAPGPPFTHGDAENRRKCPLCPTGSMGPASPGGQRGAQEVASTARAGLMA